MRNDRDRCRYELVIEGEIVGIAEYRVEGELVVFPHTEIAPTRRGHGLGARLVQYALDDVRATNRRVRPECRYVAEFIAEHPDHAGGAKVIITTSAYPRFHNHGSDAPTDDENPLRRDVARSTHSQLVDLFEYICPAGKCRHDEHGVVLRSDGLHYVGAGGRPVARWLIGQITPADWRRGSAPSDGPTAASAAAAIAFPNRRAPGS